MAGKGSRLATGACLVTNDYLVSADGSYFAILQSDGNFVIYHGSGPTNKGAFVWNSGVAPGGDQHFLAVMQSDGNLVVYRGADPARPGAFVWNSGVAPGRGQYVATLQNDGNLVITIESMGSTSVLWSAQPVPSIALTVTNQMALPMTVSLFGLKSTRLSLQTGESGSLPLFVNATTIVVYEYVTSHVDPTTGIMADPRTLRKSYSVATSDTTLKVTMVVSGGPTSFAIKDAHVPEAMFTETLPPGVTSSDNLRM